jgi:hypothetical protein
VWVKSSSLFIVIGMEPKERQAFSGGMVLLSVLVGDLIGTMRVADMIVL